MPSSPMRWRKVTRFVVADGGHQRHVGAVVDRERGGERRSRDGAARRGHRARRSPRPDPINVTRHVDVDERVTDDKGEVPCSSPLGEVHHTRPVIQSDAQCVQANVMGVLDRRCRRHRPRASSVIRCSGLGAGPVKASVALALARRADRLQEVRAAAGRGEEHHDVVSAANPSICRAKTRSNP